MQKFKGLFCTKKNGFKCGIQHLYSLNLVQQSQLIHIYTTQIITLHTKSEAKIHIRILKGEID